MQIERRTRVINRPWGPAEDEQLRRLRSLNMPMCEVAFVMHRDSKTVAQRVRELGLPHLSRHSRYGVEDETPETIERLHWLRERGWPAGTDNATGPILERIESAGTIEAADIEVDLLRTMVEAGWVVTQGNQVGLSATTVAMRTLRAAQAGPQSESAVLTGDDDGRTQPHEEGT